MKVPKMPKIKSFTTQPFDHSTTFILRCAHRAWGFIENDSDFALQAFNPTPPTGTRLLAIGFILKYFPFLIPSGNNVIQGFRNTYA